jgi:hypothetical protein
MGKSTISMAIFNSYFDITRGYPIESPSSHWRLPVLRIAPGAVQAMLPRAPGFAAADRGAAPGIPRA